MTTSRLVLAGVAAAIVMLALDALWLGVVARDTYRQGIGHLMAESPRLGVALLFYALYAAGLVIFAVAPAASLGRAAMMGGLLGLVAYGTYDLTNLATLRAWPVALSAIDMAWGSAISAASAAAGYWALHTGKSG